MKLNLNLFATIRDKVDRKLCICLPGPMRTFWRRLWLRQDEFHPCYDNDPVYLFTLSPEQRDAYMQNLVDRRDKAHKRDLGPDPLFPTI